MSFRRLSEEEEERIAARWIRVKRKWRIIGRLLFVAFLAIAGLILYYAGEGAGALTCYGAAARLTP